MIVVYCGKYCKSYFKTLKRQFGIDTSCVYFIEFLLTINMVIIFFSRKSSVTCYFHFSLWPPNTTNSIDGDLVVHQLLGIALYMG